MSHSRSAPQYGHNFQSSLIGKPHAAHTPGPCSFAEMDDDGRSLRSKTATTPMTAAANNGTNHRKAIVVVQPAIPPGDAKEMNSAIPAPTAAIAIDAKR